MSGQAVIKAWDDETGPRQLGLMVHTGIGMLCRGGTILFTPSLNSGIKRPLEWGHGGFGSCEVMSMRDIVLSGR